MTASSIGETNIFTLTVTSTNPQDAYDILNAVIQNYPQVASFVIGGTQLSMIEEPQVPTVPVNTFRGSRSAAKGVAAGLLLGLALTLLMATLQKPELLLLDEHTAALDPKTAAKVLEATQRIVEKNRLTTMMITHNMRDAITYGNRLIMMYEGHVAVDVSGEEKKHLTVEQLLELFSKASGSDEADDKLLLS